MKFYETTYILHPALQEGRLNDTISSIKNKVQSIGAELLFNDSWGRKKLAYLIDKQKYGTYIFIQFKIEETHNLKELTMEFEHNPNVLRHLTIQIEEEEILKEEPKTESIEDTDKNLEKAKQSDKVEEKKSEEPSKLKIKNESLKADISITDKKEEDVEVEKDSNKE